MATADAKTAIQIPLRPQRGEIWFSINLGLIEDVPGLYSLLAELGFTPQLAYKETREGIEVHLLLDHLQNLRMEEPPNELYEREQQVLADAINPDAIHFTCGLTRQMAA